MLVARSPRPVCAAGRSHGAASVHAEAMPLSQRPAPSGNCLVAPIARGGSAAAKSLNLRRRLLWPTPTPTTSTATAASSSSSTGLALLALSGAAAQASQSHPWGTRLSSPLVAMIMGGLAAAAFPGVLSSSSTGLPAAVSGTLVPLAACLALLEIDGDDGDDESVGSSQEEKEERTRQGEESDSSRMDPTLAVSLSFALASLATVGATLLAVSLAVRAPASLSSSFFLPSEALLPRSLLVKVAACLCASYVGGSVNFAATAAALGLSSTAQGARAMTAAFAADLVAMALYFGALAALKVPKEEEEWARGGARGDSFSTSSPSPSSSSLTTSLSAALSLAAASCSVAVGEGIAVLLGCPSASLAVAALVASAFGLAGRRRRRATTRKSLPLFAGASAASSSLMLLFFASCGAQAGSPSSLRAAASLGGFVTLLLALQLAATLALGRGIGGGLFLKRLFGLSPRLRLPLPALVVGANAAVGGPGTAAAAAQARSWAPLVRPAVLAGSAGYAIGTGVGVGVAAVLSRAFL